MAVIFVDLCSALERIAKTTKRLEIQDILTEFLKGIVASDSSSLFAVLYLCNASVFPEYEGTELGIGQHAIQTAVSNATGLSMESLRQKLVARGNLSMIAMENRVKQLFVSKKQLSVMDVFNQLRKIALETGKSSANAKKNLMLSLLSMCSPLETKYMVRLFEGQLCIGLALQTILISLGRAFGEENGDKIKDAYNKQPNLEYISRMLIEHGIEKLESVCMVTPGIPVRPMLAQPAKNMTSVLAKVENEKFLAEFKYDGERVQIHHYDGKTKIFSRNLEDLTVKYPDIASLDINKKSFILDCEAVAFDNGKILPFQTLSTRKRKNIGLINIQVCVFAFDLLFFDGRELLHCPLSERHEILVSNFATITHKFQIATGKECTDSEGIDAHFKLAIESECEGLMIKTIASTYKPAHRSNHWIKLKKDYLDSVGDTLDLVVIGAFYGKGKRTGGFGAFLLAVYNDEKDQFETCCKIGTGFDDSELHRFYELLSPLITGDNARIVHGDRNTRPDVWIVPKYVWEVKAASLSRSPVYPAGAWDDKGISLRFPRFIGERLDKPPEDATTSNQIVRMYNEGFGADVSEDDDFN